MNHRFSSNGTQFGSWRARSRLAALLPVLLLSILFAGCAGNDEEDAFVRDITEAYEKAQKSVANGNYRRAIQILEALNARFPFSDLSKQIQLELMYAYYKSGQREQAIELADTFLRENPTSPRIDYVLYIKALAYFEPGPGLLERVFRKKTDGRPPRDAEQAFSLFSRIVDRYPTSEYAEDSRQRMIYLKNRLAAYENSVARYYMKIGAWVAALNRATAAVEQYHGADSNYDSLVIMITCYENLGMFDLANDTRRVADENRPTDS